MALYRKKPVEVEATQWFKHGDHPAVRKLMFFEKDMAVIDTLEGTMSVSPGDWIITGVKGEHYPCKPDIFKASYDPVYIAFEHKKMP